MENTQIVPTAPVHAEALIAAAVEKNVPIETMERLLAMRRELKAEAAKQAFDDAMAKLQGELPVINKTKIVNDKFGKERYRFAPIDSIVEQSRDFIARNGFSYTVTAKCEDKFVTSICTVKHNMGHSEMSEFRVPIQADSYMNDAQKVASAMTFAKRYAFCNAFGIMTGDLDDDSIASGDTPNPPAPAPKPAPMPVSPPKPVQPVPSAPKGATPVDSSPIRADEIPTTANGNPKGTITDAQLKAVHAIINEIGANLDEVNEWCQTRFGCRLSGLAANQASLVIDVLMKRKAQAKPV